MNDKNETTNPEYYRKLSIEPAVYIMTNGLEFWRGNIIKYASRAGYKLYEGNDYFESEIKDLRKLIEYAEMRIEQIDFADNDGK